MSFPLIHISLKILNLQDSNQNCRPASGSLWFTESLRLKGNGYYAFLYNFTLIKFRDDFFP